MCTLFSFIPPPALVIWLYLSLLSHETNVRYMTHGGVIELAVLFAIVNDGTIDASIAAVGNDAHHVFEGIVLVPHPTRVTHNVRHRGVNDHVAGNVQVGDALRGVDHGQTRAAGVRGLMCGERKKKRKKEEKSKRRQWNEQRDRNDSKLEEKNNKKK